ncbi:MAG: prepilin-type N-terminal cleavage/methylation domain-containing protein [Paenibacillus sp.]|nr:prepilin-type N-terminal cleavage/methylation domain-containing protein [Paenibacillus sp.]
MKRRLGKEENQKGFTLIELLAVIVILGIIAVIAVPLIGNVISNSKDSADAATARQVYDAARLYVIGEKNGNFETVGNVTLAQMQDTGYLDKPLSLPSNKAVITTGTVHFNAQGQLANTTDTSTDAVSLTTATGADGAAVASNFSAKSVLSATK